MPSKRTVLAVSPAILLLVLATSAWSAPPTTVTRTIADTDNDNRLEFAPGDAYLARAELCDAGQCTDPTPVSRIMFFGQLTDFQTVDEESPARLEDVDDLGLGDDALGGAYRPEESLGIFSASGAVSTLNRVRSPLTNTLPQFAIITGDNADNTQENETEWYRDVLDGVASLNPNSGDRNYDPGLECIPWFYMRGDYQGVRYESGVSESLDWYDPDGNGDGPGYSANESENVDSVGRHVAVRNFPGLLEKAQRPFTPEGLNFPWYAVFGNHDGLVQGNFTQGQWIYYSPTDCWKDTNGNLIPEMVEPDLKRRFLNHDEWIAKHFDSPAFPGPVGHGFNQSLPSQGYYSKQIRPGWRLIGLDSVNQDGLWQGIIRDGSVGELDQFGWLDQQLTEAENAGEKAIVIAHHSLNTMSNTDFFGWQDQHCGLINQTGELGVQCEDTGNESLEAIFYRHGNVAAYIAGHEHENNIIARRQQGGPGKFWEITTASEIDWPQQSSLFELFENRDGSLSIYRTLVDSAAPLDPGNNPDLNKPVNLASISREITFNDYQANNGEDGHPDARGDDEDRNTKLVIDLR